MFVVKGENQSFWFKHDYWEVISSFGNTEIVIMTISHL